MFLDESIFEFIRLNVSFLDEKSEMSFKRNGFDFCLWMLCVVFGISSTCIPTFPSKSDFIDKL
jgi:hypothetical protein